MTGETRQLIASIRSEFRRLILNQLDSDTADEDSFMTNIYVFDEYLKSLETPVTYQVPPLGVNTTDSQPTTDIFGK
jgi:hypothetical protein